MATMLDAVINLKDNFSGTLKQVQKTVGDFSNTSKRMGRDIERTGKSVSSVGSTLTKSLTVPLLGVGAASLKLGMDFEKTMSEVKAVTGATGKEFEALQEKAREMGAKTTKSSNEAAEAMAYMGMAGWKQKDILTSIEPVLRLAEAGNIDLARASDLVTDSMSAMGIEVQDLEGYLDIVAQAARSSNTDVDAMMEAYLKVGGVLSGLNVPLEESAVSLGMLANAGLKGSEGGKKLSSILTNLTAPAGRAKTALDELGFSAFDLATGEFKGLDHILFDLKDKLSGMTEEQQNSYKAMIAGKENIDGLNALLNGLDDSYGELTESIGDSEGALMTMAEIMNDNTAGSISQLLSAIQELGLKVYDTLRPAFVEVIDIFQKFADKLNNMSPEQQEMISKFIMLAVAIGPVLMVIGKMTEKTGGLVKEFGFLAGRIKRLGFAGAILTPGVKVVLIFAAIVAAGVLLYKNWDKIKAKAEEIFPGIGEGISSAFSGMGAIFSNIINTVVPILTEGFELMKQSVQMSLEFIGEIWATHGETIIGIVQGLWGIISTVFSSSFELIHGVVMVGVEFIKLLWSLFGDTIISLAQNAWNTVSSVIGGAMKVIQGVIDVILGVISGNWGKAWEGMKTIFSGIFESLGGIAKGAMNRVISIINGALGGLNKIKIPDWSPVAAGKGINIPLIPRLAKGTDNWEGGIVQVHEEGGEIIDLPSGSRVYPHDESVSMARKQGRKESTGSQVIKLTIAKLADQIIVREESDIDKIAQKLYEKLEEADLNMP